MLIFSLACLQFIMLGFLCFGVAGSGGMGIRLGRGTGSCGGRRARGHVGVRGHGGSEGSGVTGGSEWSRGGVSNGGGGGGRDALSVRARGWGEPCVPPPWRCSRVLCSAFCGFGTAPLQRAEGGIKPGGAAGAVWGAARSLSRTADPAVFYPVSVLTRQGSALSLRAEITAAVSCTFAPG